MGVHRYNHNLETARSHFPSVVTTHTWEERWDTLRMVRAAGMEVCCGGIIGMGETVEQRAEFAAQLAELDPHEVPMNFLIPQPGTPYEDFEVVDGKDALRTVAAFRLALPRTMLRFAGGRELTLGDLGAEQGMLGGINAIIVGNYLTNLGRPAQQDLDMLDRAEDADQGAERDSLECSAFTAGSRPPRATTPRCAGARGAIEPPRYCPDCARRMVVQVTPSGWSARCSRHGDRTSYDAVTPTD